MKNILFSILAIFAVFVSNAQTVTPRGGTGANNDNTYRALTLKYVVATDAAANDTTKLNLNAYNTLVKLSPLTDSTNFNFTPITRCYFGDQVTFLIKNSSTGTKVKFVGSNVQVGSGTATLTVTASKRAVISFVFDGTTWVEAYRIVQ